MTKQERRPLIVMSVVAVIILIIVIALTVSGSDNTRKLETKPAAGAQPISQNEALRTAYIDGCSPTAGTAFCACSYDYVVDTYGLDRMKQIALSYDGTGAMPREFSEAIYACQSEL